MTAGEVAERTARELERRRAGAKRRMTRERSDGVLSRRAFPAVGVDRFRVEAEAIADLNASAAGQGGS